ncbi:hypothetical protein KLMA_10017 [Kluyveromyces marxianus DMKU3-1042]|uniref:Uncharacterized protein n=1 Tax=Kluyveromyces marxianus (strain DMKU3-1042 / BCC 29191 / NBRC 104275) TaxID=1003335 RepID=W0T6A7_KLUMD|nr:hypothetical protein KLMA_10017 [Kluyveromyces marxianus DMKU3-1042]BAO37639.1 hypothetical protein KLMA_10017 [Kluyveromyces marxianus DMKU3-1042]
MYFFWFYFLKYILIIVPNSSIFFIEKCLLSELKVDNYVDIGRIKSLESILTLF